MPELPEVETVVRDLRPHLVGATIVGARCSWARTLRTHAPDTIGPALAGRRIEAVGRRAKQIVVELSGEVALTIHLKMTGQLFVVPATLAEDPYVRLAIAFADGRELRFRDIRKFGKIGLYPRDAASGELVTEPGGTAVFAEIGPEPLDDGFDLRAFRRRLRARSGRLKSVLLDQSFVAGIGNIYADEALWLARLHPLRSASSLRPPDERHLYDAIRSILAEAISRRGSSVDDYTAPDGDGSMQDHLAVYQRTGLACRRCGRSVRRLVLGARATHFCSWCQRLSRADRKAAAAPLRTLSGAERKRGPRWSDLGTRSAAATRRAAARASAGASPDASPSASASVAEGASANGPIRIGTTPGRGG